MGVMGACTAFVGRVHDAHYPRQIARRVTAKPEAGGHGILSNESGMGIWHLNDPEPLDPASLSGEMYNINR